MAFLGAIIAAPEGFRHRIRWILKPLARIGTAINKMLQLFRPPPQEVRPQGFDASRSGNGRLTILDGFHWEPAADPIQKLDWLKEGLENLRAALQAEAQHRGTAIDSVQSELAEIDGRLNSEINYLLRLIKSSEAKTTQIDSLGLGPIAAGIILSGIPEDVAHWGAAGWIFWGACATVTLHALYSSFSKGHLITNRTASPLRTICPKRTTIIPARPPSEKFTSRSASTIRHEDLPILRLWSSDEEPTARRLRGARRTEPRSLPSLFRPIRLDRTCQGAEVETGAILEIASSP